MPDLRLARLLELATPERLRPALEPFFGEEAAQARIERTRLQAPICHWTVLRAGERRVTLKAFFSEATYERYAADVWRLYPEQVGQPEHAAGGVMFAPQLNAVLWSFPFDPAMPGLHLAADGGWVGERRGRTGGLAPRVASYEPEIGAVLAYREPASGRTLAYGKATATDSGALVHEVMARLWESPARRDGQLHVARPLGYIPEARLLLQGAVRGRPLGSDRNRTAFLELATAAGQAIAAVHATELPPGPARGLPELIERLERALGDVALALPPLHARLRDLTAHLRAAASRSSPGRLVGCHGDFKYDQLLKYRRAFVLIDFDLYCRAEAALDLGSFCAYLPPSSPADWAESAAAEQLRAAFLRAYERAGGGPVDLARLGLYEAASLGWRAMGHVWRRDREWAHCAAHFMDLAFERLVNPEPLEAPEATWRSRRGSRSPASTN